MFVWTVIVDMGLTENQFLEQVKNAVEQLDDYETMDVPAAQVEVLTETLDVESVIQATQNPSEIRKHIYIPIVNTQGQVEVQFRETDEFADSFEAEDEFTELVEEFGGTVQSVDSDSATFTITQNDNLNLFEHLNSIPASWVKNIAEDNGTYTVSVVQGPYNEDIGADYKRTVERESAEGIRLNCPECGAGTVEPDTDSNGFFCPSCYTGWNSEDIRDAFNQKTEADIREALEEAFERVDHDETDLDIEFETTYDGDQLYLCYATYEEDGSPKIGVTLDGRDLILSTLKETLIPATPPQNQPSDVDTCEFCNETEGLSKGLVNYPNENGGILRLTRICEDHIQEARSIAEGATKNDEDFKMNLAIRSM